MKKGIDTAVTNELDKAIANPDVPKIYANGFVNAIGTGDVAILFKNGNSPAAVVNLSYTVAKSLAAKIGYLIAQLEEGTGNTIMISDEINKAMLEKGKK